MFKHIFFLFLLYANILILSKGQLTLTGNATFLMDKAPSEGVSYSINVTNELNIQAFNGAQDSDIQFSINTLDAHGCYFTKDDLEEFQFTQQDIRDGKIKFHNNLTDNLPAFTFNVLAFSDSINYIIGFVNVIGVPSVNYVANSLNVIEESIVAISETNLEHVIDGVSKNDTIYQFIRYTDQGEFYKEGSLKVTQFSQEDIADNKITLKNMNPEGMKHWIPFYLFKVGTLTNWRYFFIVVNYFIKPTWLVYTISYTIGQSVLLDYSMLGFEWDFKIPSDNIIIKVTTQIGCYIEKFSNPVTEFNATEFMNMSLMFKSDPNYNGIPSMSLELNDGHVKVNQQLILNVAFIPVWVNSKINLQQGQKVEITELNILVSTQNQVYSWYQVIIVSNGYFALAFDPLNPISFFNQKDIENKTIIFQHDGTPNIPTCVIRFNDQIGSMVDKDIVFSFSSNLKIILNAISIKRGEKVKITTSQINAIVVGGIDSSFVIFTVYDVSQAKFLNSLIPDIPVSSFTLFDIIAERISFVHDGGSVSPFFQISVNDGRSRTDPIGMVIKFEGKSLPVVLKNAFKLNQGDSIDISLTVFNVANENAESDFVYNIKTATNCKFYKSDNLETPINTFKKSDTIIKSIKLIHDGSNKAPLIVLTVLDPLIIESEINVEGKIEFNLKPILITNNLKISKGEKLVLTSEIFGANDADSDNSLLTYFVKDVSNGQFENINSPGISISSFKQGDLSKRLILFVHDGTSKAPLGSLSVSDGLIQTETVNIQVDFSIPRGITGINKKGALETDFINSISFLEDQNYIVAGLYKGEILVINVAEKEKPRIIKSLDILADQEIGKFRQMIVDKDLAYFTTEEKQLLVVSFDKSTFMPTFLAKTTLEEYPIDIDVMDGVISLAFGKKGVGIYKYDTTQKLFKFLKTVNDKMTGDTNQVNSISMTKTHIIYVTGRVKGLLDSDRQIFAIKIDDDLSKMTTITTPVINLKDDAVFTVVSHDFKLCYVATKTTIEIYDISDLTKLKLSSSIKLQSPTFLSISQDNNYLAVIFDKSSKMINVMDPAKPAIVDTITYRIGLGQQLFTKLNDYSYFASSEGLQIIKIEKGLQKLLPPSLRLYDDGVNDLNLATAEIKATCKHADITRDETLVFVGCDDNGLKIVGLTDNNLKKTLPGKITDLQLSKKADYLFLAKDKVFEIYDIKVLDSMKKISTDVKTLNAIVFAVSSTNTLALIADNANNAAKLHVVSISATYTTYKLIKTLELPNTPTMIKISDNSKIGYVNCEKGGLIIVDLNDLNNISLRKETKLGEFKSFGYFETKFGSYLVIGASSEGKMKIIDVSKPETAPKVIGKRYIGKEIGGVAILKSNNYVVVQSLNSITTVEIRDVTSPVIVNQIKTSNVQSVYKMAASDLILYVPPFFPFSFFPINTFIFPVLTATNNQGKKLFTCDFYPIDPLTMDKSQENTKLLSLRLEDKWPFWANFDADQKYLFLNPPVSSNLQNLRQFSLKFTNQIMLADFENIKNGAGTAIPASDIRDQLVKHGYIDNLLFVNLKYDPDQDLDLDVGGVFDDTAKNKLKIVLNNHYMDQSITFAMEDFMNLDSAPEINPNNIAKQFKKKVKPAINNKIDFQFSPDTFSDIDTDILSYSTSFLPNWLNFHEPTQRLYGTPTKKDLGLHKISVFANDGYKTVSDSFEIDLNNKPPTFKQVENQKSIAGRAFDYTLPSRTFIDEENDPLTYSAKIIENGKEANLPNWMSFDKDRIRLFGIPKREDITLIPAENRLKQDFMIKITALDICDQPADMIFKLTVVNNAPTNNSNTINDVLIVLGKDPLSFEVPRGMFIDYDLDDVLTYEAFLVDSNGKEANLPNWIGFDKARQLFSGNPNQKVIAFDEKNNRYYQEFNIKIIAQDIVQNKAFIVFKIIVVNYAPEINPKKTLQSQFNENPGTEVEMQVSISDNTFLDKNNGSILTYGMRAAYSTSLFWDVLDKNKTSDNDQLPSWIIFDDYTKTVKMNAPQEELFSTYHINVTVSNGLLSTSDQFKITVGFSWKLILKILFGIGSVVLALIGYWAYRSVLYAIVYKKKYRCIKNEDVEISKYFQKEIYLIEEDCDLGGELFKVIKSKKDKETKWSDYITSQESLYQMLVNARQEILNSTKVIYTIDEELIKINCRIFEVVEAYIAYDALKNEQPYTNFVFDKIKKSLQNDFYSQWYKELVYIQSYYDDDIMSHKFPKIIFRDQNIQKIIGDIEPNLNLPRKLKNRSNSLDMNLFQARIKAEAIGIPPLGKGELTQGESLMKSNNSIADIQVSRPGYKKTGLWNCLGCICIDLDDIMPAPTSSSKRVGKVKEWIDYRFKKGVLIFYGKPNISDEGELNIRLFDSDAYILKDFGIKVIDKTKATDSFTIFSPGLDNEPVTGSSNKKKKVKKALEQNVIFSDEGNNEQMHVKLPKSPETRPGAEFEGDNNKLGSPLKGETHKFLDNEL